MARNRGVISIGSDSETDETYTRITRSRKKRGKAPKLSKETVSIDLTEEKPVKSKKKTVKIDDDLEITIDDDSSDYEIEEHIRAFWTEEVSEIKRFILKPSETLQSVFEYFSQKYKVPVESIHMRNQDKLLCMYDSVKSINLKATEILEAYAVDTPDNCTEFKPNKIEVKCLFQSLKKPLIFYLHPQQSLHCLAELCAKEMNCGPDRIELRFDGEKISSQDTPTSLEFEGGECLEVHLSK